MTYLWEIAQHSGRGIADEFKFLEFFSSHLESSTARHQYITVQWRILLILTFKFYHIPANEYKESDSKNFISEFSVHTRLLVML